MLSNAVWHALIGPHESFAETHGQARRYRRDMSVLSAVDELDDSASADLAECVDDSGFVIERTFTTAVGQLAHHIDLAFEMKILDDEVLAHEEPWVGFTPEEYGERIFSWEPLEALGEGLPFYPAVLIDHLRRPLPEHPVHLTSIA